MEEAEFHCRHSHGPSADPSPLLHLLRFRLFFAASPSARGWKLGQRLHACLASFDSGWSLRPSFLLLSTRRR